jgi:hypothetical protein
MNMICRNIVLVSAALLALLLAGAKYLSGTAANPAAATGTLQAPASPPGAALKMQTRGSFILTAKILLNPTKQPPARGEALRYKGEALGGGAPVQVNKTTVTLVSR